jgi:hypothetical protein
MATPHPKRIGEDAPSNVLINEHAMCRKSWKRSGWSQRRDARRESGRDNLFDVENVAARAWLLSSPCSAVAPA